MRVLPPFGRSRITLTGRSLTCCSTSELAAQEVNVVHPQAEPLLAEGRTPRQQRPIARYRLGSASITAATRSTGHGVTFRCSVRGILTEPARQGLRAISPSSTAAARTADTLAKITRT